MFSFNKQEVLWLLPDGTDWQPSITFALGIIIGKKKNIYIKISCNTPFSEAHSLQLHSNSKAHVSQLSLDGRSSQMPKNPSGDAHTGRALTLWPCDSRRRWRRSLRRPTWCPGPPRPCGKPWPARLPCTPPGSRRRSWQELRRSSLDLRGGEGNHRVRAPREAETCREINSFRFVLFFYTDCLKR